MSNILSVDNLNYKDILSGISLSLETNSFNILVGKNGSGKTTFIKIIGGLLTPDKYSEISFKNEIINKNNYNQLIKKMGICFGPVNLFDMTVLQNLIYPLVQLGNSEQEAKKIVYKLSKKMSIGYLLTKDIDELTYTEKIVVSFVCSVVHNPELVLIDIELDRLDLYWQTKIISYLKEMKKSTKIVVTSNEKNFKYADNLLFLIDGKIEIMNKDDAYSNSKIFSKCGVKPPFMVDLSQKLMSYDMIDDIVLNMDEMVDKIWN